MTKVAHQTDGGFGELALMEGGGSTWKATILATDDTHLAILEKWDF